jgi:hypothetical protein
MGVSAAPAAISSGINVTRYSKGIQRAKNALARPGGMKAMRAELNLDGVKFQTAASDARVLAERSAADAARDASIAEFTLARAQGAEQAAQFASQAAIFGDDSARKASSIAAHQATQLGILAVKTQDTAQQSKVVAIKNEQAAKEAADRVPPNPDIPLSDIFNEDGKPAVTRFQMFVWTFISIIAYFIIFGSTLYSMLQPPDLLMVTNVENLAIPDVHNTLLALMGISQGAYVAGKMAKST